jgi:hypothetical protein
MAKMKSLSDDQLSQLATTATMLIPLSDDRIEEIPTNGLYYLKVDKAHKKGQHWVWKKLKLMGYNDNEELLFIYPDGFARDCSGLLNQIYIYKP